MVAVDVEDTQKRGTKEHRRQKSRADTNIHASLQRNDPRIDVLGIIGSFPGTLCARARACREPLVFNANLVAFP